MSETLPRILVQTSRQPGLADVYNDMLSYAGAELHFREVGTNTRTRTHAHTHARWNKCAYKTVFCPHLPQAYTPFRYVCEAMNASSIYMDILHLRIYIHAGVFFFVFFFALCMYRRAHIFKNHETPLPLFWLFAAISFSFLHLSVFLLANCNLTLRLVKNMLERKFLCFSICVRAVGCVVCLDAVGVFISTQYFGYQHRNPFTQDLIGFFAQHIFMFARMRLCVCDVNLCLFICMLLLLMFFFIALIAFT